MIDPAALRALVEKLREGLTVIDEPYHHAAIADVLEEAAAALTALLDEWDICVQRNSVVSGSRPSSRSRRSGRRWTEFNVR